MGPSDDHLSTAPPKRKRSSEADMHRTTQEGSNTPDNGTPSSAGKPWYRKRIKESEARKTNRARSPSGRDERRRDDPPPARSPPRSSDTPAPRKRPGAGARIDASARKAAEDRRRQREEEERQQIAARNTGDLVSSHYNAVPQRGREWRKTDSSIRGLRSFNNWVKSALIQKFSRPDIPVRDLLVLDIGCGKGGDLQKWQSAPQMPALYVGIDPAATSIDQARGRYDEMQKRRRHPRARPLYDAQFFAQDCFGMSIGNLPIVRQVGFNPNAGPDANGNITGRFAGGGFDVVSMMFCLHYSFESEDHARGMLRNVAGALKKGGKFLGVMPNSDVLSAHVEKHLKQRNGKSKSASPLKKEEKSMYDDNEDDWDPEKPSDNGKKAAADDTWDPEKPSTAAEDDDWDPEKPMAAAAAADDDDDWDPEKPSNPTPVNGNGGEDDWDPEKPTATPNHPTPSAATEAAQALEWGNSIYKVKFPGTRALPADGVFRPPYGWKYFYYLEEAVDVPEYVVPWEGFRALAEDYGLELQFRKSFADVWEDNKHDRELGPLAERMGVRGQDGRFNVSADEMEAASFYHAFCFYKI